MSASTRRTSRMTMMPATSCAHGGAPNESDALMPWPQIGRAGRRRASHGSFEPTQVVQKSVESPLPTSRPDTLKAQLSAEPAWWCCDRHCKSLRPPNSRGCTFLATCIGLVAAVHLEPASARALFSLPTSELVCMLRPRCRRPTRSSSPGSAPPAADHAMANIIAAFGGHASALPG